MNITDPDPKYLDLAYLLSSSVHDKSTYENSSVNAKAGMLGRVSKLRRAKSVCPVGAIAIMNKRNEYENERNRANRRIASDPIARADINYNGIQHEEKLPNPDKIILLTKGLP